MDQETKPPIADFMERRRNLRNTHEEQQKTEELTKAIKDLNSNIKTLISVLQKAK